jgi:hypothetical protein
MGTKVHGQSQNVTNRVKYATSPARYGLSFLDDILALAAQPLDRNPKRIVLFNLPC